MLYNGGSYYIDEGKPLPGAIEATVRNLREIAPTWYFNVPRGYEVLLPYLRKDKQLRENFFSRLKLLWFAGAGVSQPVFDEMKALAYETCGEEILFLTGLGSTETAPFAMGRMWETRDVSNMGLPPPGVEIKLVPAQDKLEARLKGPNITPGLLAPARAHARRRSTRRATTAWATRSSSQMTTSREGGCCSAAASPRTSSSPPAPGCRSGRCARASSRTSRRCVRDVVIAGRGPQRARRPGLSVRADFPKRELRGAARDPAESSGSSNRIARARCSSEPPSLDAGEVTDKGSDQPEGGAEGEGGAGREQAL